MVDEDISVAYSAHVTETILRDGMIGTDNLRDEKSRKMKIKDT